MVSVNTRKYVDRSVFNGSVCISVKNKFNNPMYFFIPPAYSETEQMRKTFIYTGHA